jgi:FAD synthetase
MHFRYTSLGSTYNTLPNPALRVPDDPADVDKPDQPPPAPDAPPTNGHHGLLNGGGLQSARYKPAYELLDGSLERAGRIKTAA